MPLKLKGKTIPTGLIVAVSALLVLVVGVFSAFSYANGIRDAGIQKEAGLVAQYQDNQNELSNYILTFNETLGIADRQSEELNTILVEAVKGRYEGESPGTGGEMFSAIQEAYPDLTANSESYQKVQDQIVSGRNAYKNKQTLLLDKIRDYETWKDSGLVKSQMVKFLGFPSDRMEIRVGEATFDGDEALDRMKQLVLVGEAVEAYETGEQDPLIMPRTNGEDADSEG